MPGRTGNMKKSHQKKKHHASESMSPRADADMTGSELTVETVNSGDVGSEKRNGQSVASSDESPSASSTPRHPSDTLSREGSASPRSMSPRTSDRPPASPRTKTSVERPASPGLQSTSPVDSPKAVILHDLNEKLLKEVKNLRGDKEDLTKKVTQLEEQLTAVHEAKNDVASDQEALAKERDTFISEKKYLEETVSSSRIELEEAERASTVANERVVHLEKEVELLERVQKELAEKQNEYASLDERASKLSEENSALIEERKGWENHRSTLELNIVESEKTAKERIDALEDKIKALVTETEELRKSQIPEEDLLRLKDDVKDLTESRTALLKELEVVTDEKDRLQKGISEIGNELEEVQNRFAVAEEKSDTLISEKSSLEIALKKFRQDFDDAQKVNQDLDERKEALTKEVGSLEQANKALIDSQIPEEEFLALKERASKLSQEKVSAEEEKISLLSEKRRLEEDLSELRQELEEVNKHLRADQEKIVALESESKKLGVDLSTANKGVEDLESEIERFKQENSRLEGNLADVQSQNQIANVKVKTLETEVNELSSTTGSYETTISELREELVNAKDKSSELSKTLEKKQGDWVVQEQETARKVLLLETTISSLKEDLKRVEGHASESSALIESRTIEHSEKVDGLQIEISRLQDELDVTQSRAVEVDGKLGTQTREFAEKFQERETHVSSLQEELEAAKSKLAEATDRLDIEKGIFESHSTELTEHIGELTFKVDLLESELQMQKDEALQAAEALSSSEANIRSLQDVITDSQAKCEELIAELTELKDGKLKDKHEELTTWQSQVKKLEETLEDAKSESVRKAMLYQELELAKTEAEKRTESTKYILPAATAATGAIAATGLMLILKALSRNLAG